MRTVQAVGEMSSRRTVQLAYCPVTCVWRTDM